MKIPKLSRISKFTLVANVAQTILLAVLEGLVINFHHSFVANFKLNRHGNGISEADIIYHTIFILYQVFQTALCWDAIWNRNTIQLVALVTFNTFSLIYASIQLYQHKILEDEGTEGALFSPVEPGEFTGPEDAKRFFKERMRPLEYVIIGLVATFALVQGFLVRKLIFEFGWENYRRYSADLRIRRAFVALAVLMTLIKLDIFFVGSYALQLIPSRKIGYSNSIAETTVVFILGTILFGIAWYSTTREQKYGLLVVICMLVVIMCYLIYRLINVAIPPHQDEYDPYEFTRRFLIFFLVVTLALVGATVVYTFIVVRNLLNGTYVLTVYGRDTPEMTDAQATDVTTKESKRKSHQRELASQMRIPRRLSIDA